MSMIRSASGAAPLLERKGLLGDAAARKQAPVVVSKELAFVRAPELRREIGREEEGHVLERVTKDHVAHVNERAAAGVGEEDVVEVHVVVQQCVRPFSQVRDDGVHPLQKHRAPRENRLVRVARPGLQRRDGLFQHGCVVRAAKEDAAKAHIRMARPFERRVVPPAGVERGERRHQRTESLHLSARANA
eukprot:scaffold10448_cov68-Phaeocystis_antarctica.AAC.3